MNATIRAIRPGRGDELVGGPDDTLTGFIGAHSVGLTRFAYLLCGDRGLAEDLVQDTFVALYRRFGDRLPVAAPVAYARRSVVNGYISRGRRRDSAVLVLDELPEQGVADPDVAEQDAMWRALAALPDRQRAVLVMRYYLGLSEAVIARALGCRAGTVRSLASRAFAALRESPDLAIAGESR